MKYISLSLQTLESKNDHVVERSNFDIMKIFPSTPLYRKVHKLCAKTSVLYVHSGTFQEKASFKRVYSECIIFQFQESKRYVLDLFCIPAS